MSDIWVPRPGAIVSAQGWPILIIPKPSVWLGGSENITRARALSPLSAYETEINQQGAKQAVPPGHLVAGTSLLCRTWRSSFFSKITAWELCQTNNYIINDINSVRRFLSTVGLEPINLEIEKYLETWELAVSVDWRDISNSSWGEKSWIKLLLSWRQRKPFI